MPINSPLIPADPTRESFLLGGRVRLIQPEVGYRAGMDAALLAAALDAAPGYRLLEAGCGPGAAVIQAAYRLPHAQFLGIERDLAALALMERNIQLNAVADRVSALAADVDQSFSSLGLAPFDAAFANPPFFDDPRGLRGPHPSRRAAWLATGGLQAWTRFLVAAVRPKGEITLIHRADRLLDILTLLSAGAGSFRVRAIHPFHDQPAKRVLVRAKKGGRAPLALLPPLILHARTNQGDAAKHTAEADAIFRGEAPIFWD